MLSITTASEPSNARISCAKNPYLLSPVFSSDSRFFLNQNDFGFNLFTKSKPWETTPSSILSLLSEVTVNATFIKALVILLSPMQTWLLSVVNSPDGEVLLPALCPSNKLLLPVVRLKPEARPIRVLSLPVVTLVPVEVPKEVLSLPVVFWPKQS